MVTELPYGVGPEKVIARIKDLVQAKKLQGIADVQGPHRPAQGLRLVIEIRSGFHPEAVLEELYRLTPMEDTFGINNVALVDGQPRVLGLRELLRDLHRPPDRRGPAPHRVPAAQAPGPAAPGRRPDHRAAQHRRSHRRDQDERRRRGRQGAADERLRPVRTIQAQYILDTPLRRLTKFDKLELEREQRALAAEIAELTAILESEQKLRELVSSELAAVAEKFGTPRRTVLLEASGAAKTAAVPLEVADDPCTVLLSSAGLLARTAVSKQAGQQELVEEETQKSDNQQVQNIAQASAPSR